LINSTDVEQACQAQQPEERVVYQWLIAKTDQKSLHPGCSLNGKGCGSGVDILQQG
jgi:hypothetical protein